MNGYMIAYLLLIAASLGIALAKHGQSRVGETYSVWNSLLAAAIGIGLLYMGGAFG